MKLKSTDIRKYATIAIAAAWLLFQSYIALVKPFHPTLQVPIHLIFALAIVYLYNPIYKKRESLKKVAWLDLISFAGIAFLAYYYIHETLRLQNRIPYFSPLATIDVVAFFVLTILLLEAVRRTLGWNLLIFIGVFLLYAWLGQYLPRGSGLRSTGTDPMEFVELISMSSGGILGTPLTTSATYLFYFIIFGSLFSACGGGQLLIDIGLKVGKGTGGPAKAAVVSSGLLGMVSGAAVANVSTTGVMTIPMMKKVGYTPEQAGAIEAVASTGGQIMPPIMGIGAFIMAEMLGVSYGTVATAAIIPAVAYYFAIFLVVDFIARKNSAGVVSGGFNTQPIFRRLYLLVPAVILVYFIVTGASLMRSAVWAIAAILIINVLNPKRASLKELGHSLMVGCKQAAGIAIPTAAVGIIIGIVIQSGLATKLSTLMIRLGGDRLILALLLTMVGCMLLGMALPTVAAYMIANILFVPTLTKLGVASLPANMFVFYFGIFAQITPPVCLASFTAAGIAGGDSWKTGWAGFRYSIVAFLTAFAFVYEPSLLLMGTPAQIVQSAAVLFIGTFFLAAGIEGYVGRPVEALPLRIALTAAGILIITPESISSAIGYALGISVILLVNLRGLKSCEDSGKRKAVTLRLALLAVAGGLVIVPENITTFIGLAVLAAAILQAFLVGRKNKPVDAVVVEAAEVMQVDLVDVEED